MLEFVRVVVSISAMRSLSWYPEICTIDCHLACLPSIILEPILPSNLWLLHMKTHHHQFLFVGQSSFLLLIAFFAHSRTSHTSPKQTMRQHTTSDVFDDRQSKTCHTFLLYVFLLTDPPVIPIKTASVAYDFKNDRAHRTWTRQMSSGKEMILKMTAQTCGETPKRETKSLIGALDASPNHWRSC